MSFVVACSSRRLASNHMSPLVDVFNFRDGLQASGHNGAATVE
jgi:hypothetical protein